MEFESLQADLDSHHIEGIAIHGNIPFSAPLVSHVVGDLWIGGCIDRIRLPDDFEYVVSLYKWERYALGPNTLRHEVEMYDSSDDLNADQLYVLAQMVNNFRTKGKTLVHCQAGLNRSSLVTALALILDGMRADEAIELLREKRSPAVLCNKTFEQWLRAQRM